MSEERELAKRFCEKLRPGLLRLKASASSLTTRLLLLTLLAALLIIFSFWLYAVSPGPTVKKDSIRVYVPPRTGLRGIRDVLASSGVIVDDFRFVLLAKVMGVGKRLKAGEYVFAAGVSPRAILAELENGNTVCRAITIPEGTNIYQAADIMANQGWADRDDFLRLVRDRSFVKDLGLKVGSLEGYLYPDTYFFEKGENLPDIVKKMVERMREVFAVECVRLTGQDEENCSLGAKLAGTAPTTPHASPLTPHALLTLASIVEKETALGEERPLVAEVFFNRLRKGMRLQADPTVIYGLAKFNGPLTRKDLKSDNPYNTYMKRGLPPGPICSPGRSSIAAVMNPASKKYYYFVSQNDGSHYFSRNLKEHNRAVARFRKNKSPKGN